MLLYLTVFIFVLILGTFLGYIFHRMFHQPWSGRFYKSHMVHHLKLYPITDYYSDTYRDPGKDNTVILFGICFAPLGIGIILLTIFSIIPILMSVMIIVEMSLIGIVNNSMHDAFHLKKSFWDKFWFFARLRKLHFLHHSNMKSNFGIYSFAWDYLLGTLKK